MNIGDLLSNPKITAVLGAIAGMVIAKGAELILKKVDWEKIENGFGNICERLGMGISFFLISKLANIEIIIESIVIKTGRVIFITGFLRCVVGLKKNNRIKRNIVLIEINRIKKSITRILDIE